MTEDFNLYFCPKPGRWPEEFIMVLLEDLPGIYQNDKYSWFLYIF